ncbi:MAG: glycosyltransferase family 2 protein [Caulobacteraceae bacterium]
MTSRRAGLRGLIPNLRKPKPRYGGWARADSDHVIRGWVADLEDFSRRIKVDVRIDGEVVGTALADRYDAKVEAAGVGDGSHAFALTIPAWFRDGAAHGFEVSVVGGGYRLLSKATSFTVNPRFKAPDIVVEQVAVDQISGVMAGAAGGTLPLELWSGGKRLAEALEVRWRSRGPEHAFEAALPPDVLIRLERDALIAAPGMAEAGLGAPVFQNVRVIARPSGEGVAVRVEGMNLPVEGVEARLRRGGEVIAAAVSGGRGRIAAVGSLKGAAVEIALNGEAVPALTTPIDLSLEPLTRNAAFAQWDSGGPRFWSSPDVAVERGFAPHPGLSGHTVRADVAAGSTPVLLRQPLSARPNGEREGVLAAVARTSGPIGLTVRVVDEVGVAVQKEDPPSAAPWTWTHLEAAADYARLAAHDSLWLELAVTEAPDADTTVEVAGLRVGGDAFLERAAISGNLIENASLTDWPHGIAVEAGAARAETAAGWFVQNRRCDEPARAAALPLDGAAACALALSAARVDSVCRLEVRLRGEVLDHPRLTLRLDASAAPSLAAGVKPSPFTVIERVFLMKRAGEAPPEVLATVARRVLLRTDPRTVRLDFDLPEAARSETADAALFLAFDFNRPFQVEFRGLSLTAATDEPDSAYLAIEDPSVAAQTTLIKGLEHWSSPVAHKPGLKFDPARDDAFEPERWAWSGANLGSVEVVVCVHDAADETLACLGSMVGASSIPHTVRIIDDGSGEDARRRLAGFVADKPWMRLVTNPANLGYTASANLGIRGSDADWVVLLNSDTIVTPGWLEGLLECAASDPNIALVGPVSNAASWQSVPELKDRAGRWKTSMLPPGWTPARMAEFVRGAAAKAFPRVPLLNGFCTLIRRDAFVALGGFNEAAFPRGYGEENDLCVRAAKAGYGLAVADHVYVYHAKSASFGSKQRTELQKTASEALARLHPGLDWAELGERMQETPALIELRAAVRALYKAEA